jgi:CIC family chloride channel protein
LLSFIKTRGSVSDADAPQAGEQRLSTPWMVCLALLVGVFGGIGSVLFRAIIAFCHNLFFFGRISLDYDPLTHTAPSPWGALIILVPVVGAVIVTWIIKTLAPEARGHGVPEVMNAIYYREGRIRPVLVGAKAVASAISIGTGGSVGREGPIIQIGSAFASTLGQIINMPARQRVVLVSAGAAAGIAATFNAPIGGLAFAIELMLVSISARTVSLVALATVTATYIGRFYTGMHPTFNVPGLVNIAYDHVLTFYSLLLCVPLGLIMGLVATLFIHSIYWAEDHFDAKIKNQYLRHMSGMLMVGVVIYLLMQTTSHYYVDGVGYATIMDILTDTLTNPGLLLALFAAKLLATSLTLGSGASGGVFSPSLFLGATFGAAFGAVMAPLFPSAHLDPVIFAIAGMAAMISGTTGAVITAITMMFEQTYDYSAMLPVIITVALAYAVRSHLTPESIYTLKLVRRGVTLPRGLQAAVSSSRVAASIMSRDFQVIERDNLSEWQATHRPGESPRYTIIAESGQLYGIARDELTYLMDTTDLENLVDSNIFMVTAMTAWPVLMRGIKKTQSDVVLVMRRRRSNDVKDIIGVITAREIFAATRDEMELVE